MLKNSPASLPRGATTGAAGAAALRTAFGDLDSIFVSAGSGMNFAYTNAFPEADGISGLLDTVTYLPVSRTAIAARRPALIAIGELMGLRFASFSGPLATYTNPSTYNQLTIDTVESNEDNLAHLIPGNKIEIDIAGRYLVIASVGVYPSDYSTPFNGGIFVFLGISGISLTYLLKSAPYVTAAGVTEDLISIPVGALNLADGDTLDLQMSISLGTDADAYVYEVTLLKLEN